MNIGSKKADTQVDVGKVGSSDGRYVDPDCNQVRSRSKRAESRRTGIECCKSKRCALPLIESTGLLATPCTGTRTWRSRLLDEIGEDDSTAIISAREVRRAHLH